MTMAAVVHQNAETKPLEKQGLHEAASGRITRIDTPRRAKNMVKKTAAIVSNSPIARRLLNVREAALYLGIEVDTVYKKSRLREVPCVKVGHALRFDVQALERYIEQHAIETID